MKRLLYSPLFGWQWAWPAGALAALTLVSIIPPLSRAMPMHDNPDWPVGAADWMEAHGVEGRIFAAPDDGAYLMWRQPSVRCYVDTRYLFFPPELIEDCQYLPQLAPVGRNGYGASSPLAPTIISSRQAARTAYSGRRSEPHVPDPLYCDKSVVLLRTEQVAAALNSYKSEQAAVRP